RDWKRTARRYIAAVAGMAVWGMVAAGPAGAQPASSEAASAADRSDPRLVVPMLDSDRGKRLFVDKGCILCHSVNGVGGLAGPALDAPEDGGYVDLMDFMARMWRGAFAMIELQGMELGYQIDFSGPELADMAAFLADKEKQERFGDEDVPDLIRDMFIRTPYELEDGLQVPSRP
ncbi:MAG: c-type cytochrome, partial [Pseudomonadota bacterium]